MKKVTRIEGRAWPLGRAHVDTDTIIAAEHLKTVTRAGLGRHAFAALRGGPDAPPDGAAILIAGANFGCGSSREHAVWALTDFGIGAVLAPSFSDIFAGNAVRNGLVAARVDPDDLTPLLALAGAHRLTVDLDSMTVMGGGRSFPIRLDPAARTRLMRGLDEIALTLAAEAAIAAHEQRPAGPGIPAPAIRPPE